jgi:hypothetical protein
MPDLDIRLPADGAPDDPPGSDLLLGVDGNAFAVMGATAKALRRAGATPAFVDAYRTLAMSGDYDHLLAVSMAALDGMFR